MPAQRQGGTFDRRITILRRDTETTSYNEKRETFTDLATVAAGRRDVSAAEAYRSAEIGAQLTTRFVVRWSTVTASVTPLDRVRFRNDVYNITAVRDVGRNDYREIDAVVRADK